MIKMTEAAVNKALYIKTTQSTDPKYLRIGVQGGGCSGFQYSMQFDTEKGPLDKEVSFDNGSLKVLVDATSLMYLNDCTVDYLETLEGSGFKFNNPNVKSTCGCGQSFQV